MAREEKIKTPLGQRLRDVRAHFGDPDREIFCLRLGISKGSLGNYERGDRVPDSSVLQAYRQELGVNVNWIVTGDGQMFDHPEQSQERANALNHSIFRAVKRLVREINEIAGIRLPDDARDEEAVRWYNHLVDMARGNMDEGKLRSLFTALEYDISEAVKSATSQPGSGKRSAS